MEVLLDEFSFFIILQATIVPSFSVYIFRLAFFSHLLGLPFDQIFFLNIYEATVAQLSLLLNLQVGRDDFKLNVKLQLFALVAKQPTFHQLRSVEQLGYITVLMQRYMLICSIIYVFSLKHLNLFLTTILNLCRNDCGIRGLQFIIQSTVKVLLFSYLEVRTNLK